MPAIADTSPVAIDRLARDLKIPPCPAVLERLVREARKDDPDPRTLAGLINQDAGLAAAVLRAVNSPVYGLSRKAQDVQQALAIMGVNATMNLINGLMLRQAFPAASGTLMQRFWDQSSGVALAAVAVARRIPGCSREEAHTYALFRNCGIAVMISRFPDYGPFLAGHATTPGPALLAAEGAKYGLHHARIGYALARTWGLPETLAYSILFHHHIDLMPGRLGEGQRASPTLVAAALLAEQVANLEAGGNLTSEWLTHEQFVLASLQISAEDVADILGTGRNGPRATFSRSLSPARI